jgi:uracil-DNA glycosylase
MEFIQNDWAEVLKDEFSKPYFVKLWKFVEEEYATQVIYPQKEEIFSALQLTPFAETKVVIIGQDPYHGAGQAHGLSFSVKPGVKQPPSLKNIFKELKADLGCDIPNHGYLEKWAKQGVLMLNTVLTVRESKPNSHQGKGWEIFTDEVIRKLNEREDPVVFLLWGRHAQAKGSLVTNSWHGVFESAHPSPFAAKKGFFGSRPFSKANQFLRQHGYREIDWQLPNL